MQMEMIELYRKLREEGRSVGHAQWCVGMHCFKGQGMEQDLDKAEEWFLRAWDHRFPGTANTQAFILKRMWDKFIAGAYPESPRLLALLSEARASSDERRGTILICVHNDAQKEWINDRIEEMIAAFHQFTSSRFLSVSIRNEKIEN